MEMQVPARSTRWRVQPLGVRGGCCRYRVNSALILVPVSTTRNVASQALPDLGQVLPAAPADPEQTTQAVYIGLGLTLLSFVLTFGVAPRFKSAFKEPETWQEVRQTPALSWKLYVYILKFISLRCAVNA